jgi:cytoskeletal protein CcmA (bactofilin family)
MALTLVLVIPVQAFEGRGANRVVVAANEVINDDLYVGANEFVLDGAVNGDVVAFGTTITINGTIKGDLLTAGQTIIVNGNVEDDIRMAGAALFVGDSAKIGGDIISAGASLETRPGSVVGQDVVFAGGQALFAGEISRNLDFGGGGLELRGGIGGNVRAEVGDPSAEAGNPPLNMFMPQVSVPMPTVRSGLTINPSAKIEGNLAYTSLAEFSIPAGVVTGKVTHTEPVVGPEAVQVAPPTPAQTAAKWFLDLLRLVVTLILFGLLLGWLAPMFVKTLAATVQSKPWPSLGWGVIAYAAFFFALLAVVTVMILGGIIFGGLTLSSLSGTIIWVGILMLFALILGFVLATSFLTKIVVGWLGGRWILSRFNPALGEHKVWPLVVGVVIVAVLVSLPFVGWLFSLLMIFAGLGAMWLWARERMAKPVPVTG